LTIQPMTSNSSRYLRDDPTLEKNLISKPKIRNEAITNRALVESKAQILSDLVPFLLCRDGTTKRCLNDDDSVVSSSLNKRVEWKKDSELLDVHERNTILNSEDGHVIKKRKRNEPDTNEEESESPATNGEDDICNRVGSRSSTPTAMTHHQVELENLIDENRLLKMKRRQVREDHKSLMLAYKFGLHQVSTLNDLTFVPDNIMEGNFPKNEI